MHSKAEVNFYQISLEIATPPWKNPRKSMLAQFIQLLTLVHFNLDTFVAKKNLLNENSICITHKQNSRPTENFIAKWIDAFYIMALGLLRVGRIFRFEVMYQKHEIHFITVL